jgi:two-component system CheB/CheR fusion protein
VGALPGRLEPPHYLSLALPRPLVFGLHRVPRVVHEPEILKALVGVHVLVVDDDPGARELLEAVLSYCGAFVTLLATAREALDLVRKQPVDVVIVDVLLPDQDGYWLMREVGALNVDRRGVPVVALATDRVDGPDRTLAAGFQGHLRKPVDPWEMCRMVASLARKP